MLKVEKLSLGFRRYSGLWRQEEVSLLSQISFDLSQGEVLGCIGASGAGKSLLAHAIMGLLPPNAFCSGRVTLFGRPISFAKFGRDIGFIAQDISHLDPLAKIGAQHKWAQKRHGQALSLKDFDLDGRLYPHELSGGMARRAMIALAGKPKLVIADEPTAGLDPQARRFVLQHLRAHADSGGAVLLIGHDLMAMLPFVDRIAVLDEGRLCALEVGSAFRAKGDALQSPKARAIWLALPDNDFVTDA